MALSIAELAARAATLVEAATPDVDPAITYREASYAHPLPLLGPRDTDAETTREFQVDVSAPISIDFRSCTKPLHTLVVIMRYAVAAVDDRERLSRLRDRIRSDQARIADALVKAGAGWSAESHFLTIRYQGGGPITASPKHKSIVTATTSFGVDYELGES